MTTRIKGTPRDKTESRIESRLRATLKDRGISLADLARATGLTYQALHRIVSNQNGGISFESLARICTHLDCRVSDVIDFMPEE